jgi:hypothetical protein
MRKIGCNNMSKVIVKAMRPHRQKILTEDGEEMRLQRWANKKAADAIRGSGGDVQGDQFTQARDSLMHSAVANPDEHGLKFLDGRIPFEGQELEEELSKPDVEGEAAAIDSQFAPFSQEKLEEVGLNRVSYPNQTTQDKSDYHTTPKTPDIFDTDGKLREGIAPEKEEEEEEDEDDDREPGLLSLHPDIQRKAFLTHVNAFNHAMGFLIE